MITRNPEMARLKSGYLFPEINKRKKDFLAKHPEARLISLGIGDTTEPIPQTIVKAMWDATTRLGSRDTYVGYGPEQGLPELRQQIASTLYKGRVNADEIFVSDGAKCDIGRLQLLFGSNVRVAVQDPAYPVYVDGSIIQGVNNIHFMKCSPDNDFFPDLTQLPKVDLIYICSPNNPTGAVCTHSQLQSLVDYAKANRLLILFDAAYADYIQDPTLPRSIYEIEGAEEVAIEIGSFSKLAGFTGVRLGWTVVPEALKYANGDSIRSDWNRVMTTLFNGASYISQQGGLAVLQPDGLREVRQLIGFYMENAKLIKQGLQRMGYTVYGGDNAPYLWVKFPGRTSWEVFQQLLEKAHVVSTPGSGFGPAGEGFVRFTAYGSRDNVLEAIARLSKF